MNATASFLDVLATDPASLIFCIPSVISFIFFFSSFDNPLVYFQLLSFSSRIYPYPPATYSKYLIYPKNLFISSNKPEYWLYHKPQHFIFKLNPYMIRICLVHRNKHDTNKVTKEVFCMCSDFLNFNITSWYPLKMSTKNK